MFSGLISKYLENFSFFYKRLGHRMLVMVFFTLITGLLDGMGLTMFLPLFQIAADNHSLNSDPSGIAKAMQYVGLSISLRNVLMIMVGFYVAKGIFQYFKLRFDTNTARFYMISTRKSLVAKFSSITYQYFATSNVGRIQNTMTGELQTIYNAYIQYLNVIQQAIMILVYASFAVVINAQFAILIAIGGILFNFIFRKIYKKTKLSSRLRVAASNNYQSLIIQFVQNFKYLKATGLLQSYSRKIDNKIDDIETQSRKMGYMNAYAGAIREPILILVVASVILLEVNVFGGKLSTIIISLLFFYRALTAVTFLQTSINSFNMMIGSLENVEWFEKELFDNREELAGATPMGLLQNGLTLSNVSYSYRDNEVLKGIDLEIAPKEFVAFVGESGSGKTTLVNILAALLPIQKGEYHINGINSREVRIEEFQKKIGYISQEPVIFSDTIFNNVTFWSKETPEVLRDFEKALQQAQILEYVQSLPDSYNTMLGNNGINLSGGQKQRISIARELFKSAEILIFDEATSALDSETEKAIQNNIDSLKGEVTMIVIAHRLSTVANVDRIYHLESGRILSSGSFEELIQTSTKFKSMVELQAI